MRRCSGSLSGSSFACSSCRGQPRVVVSTTDKLADTVEHRDKSCLVRSLSAVYHTARYRRPPPHRMTLWYRCMASIAAVLDFPQQFINLKYRITPLQPNMSPVVHLPGCLRCSNTRKPRPRKFIFCMQVLQRILQTKFVYQDNRVKDLRSQ